MLQQSTYGQSIILLQTLRTILQLPSGYWNWNDLIQFWVNMYKNGVSIFCITKVAQLRWRKAADSARSTCNLDTISTVFDAYKENMDIFQKLLERCSHTKRKTHISCIVKHLDDDTLLNAAFLKHISIYLFYGTSQPDHDFWRIAWQNLDCCTLFWCAKLATRMVLTEDSMRQIIGTVLLSTSKQHGPMFQRYQEKLEQEGLMICLGEFIPLQLIQIMRTYLHK